MHAAHSWHKFHVQCLPQFPCPVRPMRAAKRVAARTTSNGTGAQQLRGGSGATVNGESDATAASVQLYPTLASGATQAPVGTRGGPPRLTNVVLGDISRWHPSHGTATAPGRQPRQDHKRTPYSL